MYRALLLVSLPRPLLPLPSSLLRQSALTPHLAMRQLEREYSKLTEKCQGDRWNAETKLICQRRDELGYKLGR